MRSRFWAMIRNPACSIMALIAPVRLRSVASGLMIEKVRSTAIHDFLCRETGDVDEREVQNHQRQADGEAGDRCHSLAARRSEDHDDEEQSRDELGENGRTEPELAEIAGAPAGLPEPGGRNVITLELALQDDHQDGGAGDAPE